MGHNLGNEKKLIRQNLPTFKNYHKEQSAFQNPTNEDYHTDPDLSQVVPTDLDPTTIMDGILSSPSSNPPLLLSKCNFKWA